MSELPSEDINDSPFTVAVSLLLKTCVSMLVCCSTLRQGKSIFVYVVQTYY